MSDVQNEDWFIHLSEDHNIQWNSCDIFLCKKISHPSLLNVEVLYFL